MVNVELLFGLGDKNKIKINPQGNGSKKMLVNNLNRRIVSSDQSSKPSFRIWYVDGILKPKKSRRIVVVGHVV
jgi:hypothetical protein